MNEYQKVDYNLLGAIPSGKYVSFTTYTYIGYPPEDDGTRYMCMGEMGVLAFGKEIFFKYFQNDRLFEIIAGLLEQKQIKSMVKGKILEPIHGIDMNTETGDEEEGLWAAVEVHEFSPEYSLDALMEEAVKIDKKGLHHFPSMEEIIWLLGAQNA